MIEREAFCKFVSFFAVSHSVLASFTFVSTFTLLVLRKSLLSGPFTNPFGTNAFAGIEPLFKIVVAIPCLSKASEIAFRVVFVC